MSISRAEFRSLKVGAVISLKVNDEEVEHKVLDRFIKLGKTGGTWLKIKRVDGKGSEALISYVNDGHQSPFGATMKHKGITIISNPEEGLPKNNTTVWQKESNTSGVSVTELMSEIKELKSMVAQLLQRNGLL